MKTYKLLIITLCIILISITVTMTTYSFFKKNTPSEVNKIPMSVEVKSSRVLGIGLVPDTLLFGRISPGSASRQEFTIKNEETNKEFIIYVEGEMAGWTTPSEDKFTMKAGEVRTISVSCQPPRGIEERWYNSTMMVVSRTI